MSAAFIITITLHAVTSGSRLHALRPHPSSPSLTFAFRKPFVQVPSVFWQDPRCLALGESEFSQPSCSPDSSCQCGSEGYPASGRLLHVLCQREWCSLSRTSLFCNKYCRQPTLNLQFFHSYFSGPLWGILRKKSDTNLKTLYSSC